MSAAFGTQGFAQGSFGLGHGCGPNAIEVAEPPWVVAPVSSDALGQVGTMYPGPRDEPGRQGRDSPLGLLIAPGILLRLVPGSPANPYLGSRGRALKLIRRLFEHFRQPLQCGRKVRFQ